VPLLLKLGGHDALPGRAGLDTPELVRVAARMQDEGLDAIEITVGHYESGPLMVRGKYGPFFDGMLEDGLGRELPAYKRAFLRAARRPLAALLERVWPYREGYNLPYAEAFKRRLTIPVICVGGFRTAAAMEAAIRAQRCDAVSVARAMIADPLLYQHLREGTSGPRCELCNGCIARAGARPIDCYSPSIRREKDAMLAARGFGFKPV
jgi:2,4-dienoyl-CoA reductase-like NADH-dependent reductase (Old Yellow Enzyme family)